MARSTIKSRRTGSRSSCSIVRRAFRSNASTMLTTSESIVALGLAERARPIRFADARARSPSTTEPRAPRAPRSIASFCPGSSVCPANSLCSASSLRAAPDLPARSVRTPRFASIQPRTYPSSPVSSSPAGCAHPCQHLHVGRIARERVDPAAEAQCTASHRSRCVRPRSQPQLRAGTSPRRSGTTQGRNLIDRASAPSNVADDMERWSLPHDRHRELTSQPRCSGQQTEGSRLARQTDSSMTASAKTERHSKQEIAQA